MFLTPTPQKPKENQHYWPTTTKHLRESTFLDMILARPEITANNAAAELFGSKSDQKCSKINHNCQDGVSLFSGCGFCWEKKRKIAYPEAHDAYPATRLCPGTGPCPATRPCTATPWTHQKPGFVTDLAPRGPKWETDGVPWQIFDWLEIAP